MLRVENLISGYKETDVIKQVTFDVKAGTTNLLLGLNGMGKTTLLMTLAGIIRVKGGRVMLDDAEITDESTYARAKKGLVFVGENAIFPNLSVMDNFKVATFAQPRNEAVAKIKGSIKVFPEIQQIQRAKAASLSGGQRKLLSIAMAYSCAPKVLLLDEPSAGLSPIFVEKVIDGIKRLKELGTTIIIAEQNPEFIKIADYIMFIDSGNIVYFGSVADASQNQNLEKTFFSLS